MMRRIRIGLGWGLLTTTSNGSRRRRDRGLAERARQNARDARGRPGRRRGLRRVARRRAARRRAQARAARVLRSALTNQPIGVSRHTTHTHTHRLARRVHAVVVVAALDRRRSIWQGWFRVSCAGLRRVGSGGVAVAVRVRRRACRGTRADAAAVVPLPCITNRNRCTRSCSRARRAAIGSRRC